MIRRLRPPLTGAQLAATYPEPHDYRAYGPDHRIRVAMTITLAQAHHPGGPVADLSCGLTGDIAYALDEDPTLGDLAAGWPHHGPIDTTIADIGPVETFVCSETLEHLDTPAVTLAKIREKAHRLVLTTPIDNWDDTNPEHYWAWDREAVEGLAYAAGWHTIAARCTLDVAVAESYTHGIWILT